MVTDNGNVDPDELLMIPLEALRDEDADGTYDILEPGGFKITRFGKSGNLIHLTWTSFPGRQYRIQSSTTMTGGSWTDVPDSAVTAPGGVTATSATVTGDSAPRRFFRVVLIP